MSVHSTSHSTTPKHNGSAAACWCVIAAARWKTKISCLHKWKLLRDYRKATLFGLMAVTWMFRVLKHARTIIVVAPFSSDLQNPAPCNLVSTQSWIFYILNVWWSFCCRPWDDSGGTSSHWTLGKTTNGFSAGEQYGEELLRSRYPVLLLKPANTGFSPDCCFSLLVSFGSLFCCQKYFSPHPRHLSRHQKCSDKNILQMADKTGG